MNALRGCSGSGALLPPFTEGVLLAAGGSGGASISGSAKDSQLLLWSESGPIPTFLGASRVSREGEQNDYLYQLLNIK